MVGTKPEADVALAKLVTDVETGQVAKSHPGSVADLLGRWLGDIAPLRSSTTLRIYARAVEARDLEVTGVLANAVLGAMKGSVQPGEAHPPGTAEADGPR